MSKIDAGKLKKWHLAVPGRLWGPCGKSARRCPRTTSDRSCVTCGLCLKYIKKHPEDLSK